MSAIALVAAVVAGREALGMLRADRPAAVARRRAEVTAFTSWRGLAIGGGVSVLALLCASEAFTGDGSLGSMPAWLAACLLGVYGATRSHDRVDLVVLLASALGITGLHAQYLFLTADQRFEFSLYYAPMLVVLWAAATGAVVYVGADPRDLARVLPAAFVALLVLGLVIDPGPYGVPLDVRLGIASVLALPLGLGAALAPRRTTLAGLAAVAAAMLVDAATVGWTPGLVGTRDVVAVAMPLLGLGGMYLITRHGVGGEETRRL